MVVMVDSDGVVYIGRGGVVGVVCVDGDDALRIGLGRGVVGRRCVNIHFHCVCSHWGPIF